MKVLYIAALMLSCIVPVHGISMQELQNSGRYELLHGFGESGKGDGTYIDKESIQSINGQNGTKQITVTQYVLMPAGDTIEEKQTVYSFDTKQSFANLIKRLEAHQFTSYKELWAYKQKHAGITATISQYKCYHNDGTRYDMQTEEKWKRMASVPVDFGFAGYLWANRLYERSYGVQFDDVAGK